MRKVFALISTLILLSGCAMSRFSDQNASGYRTLDRESCVPYARRVSGINLRGDAWTWWEGAAGKYQRGNVPEPGAMLVLAKTNRLRSGHLAVVTDVVNPRTINVTHANWGDDMVSRRIVYESMRAQDVSPQNNWASVRFWNREHDVFGSAYLAHGFIYNRPENMPMQPMMPAMPVPAVMQTITYAPPATPMPVYAPPPPAMIPARPVQMRPIIE